MLAILSLSWEKEKFSPFQSWCNLCESHLVKQCGQVGFLPCIRNDIFQDSKKHSPSPIGRIIISNCEYASPNSHTFKSHPRTLEQKSNVWFQHLVHEPLKSSMGITQPKRHHHIGKCTPWSGECCFQDVFLCNFDLVITIITIPKTI